MAAEDACDVEDRGNHRDRQQGQRPAHLQHDDHNEGENEDVLEYCEKNKIAFIPWFPLAAGRLSGAESAVTHIAKEAKATPSQVSLAWLLWRSPVILPIPGTSQVRHLEENVASAGLKIDFEAKGLS